MCNNTFQKLNENIENNKLSFLILFACSTRKRLTTTARHQKATLRACSGQAEQLWLRCTPISNTASDVPWLRRHVKLAATGYLFTGG
jgi:hypothetical protein